MQAQGALARHNKSVQQQYRLFFKKISHTEYCNATQQKGKGKPGNQIYQ